MQNTVSLGYCCTLIYADHMCSYLESPLALIMFCLVLEICMLCFHGIFGPSFLKLEFMLKKKPKHEQFYTPVILNIQSLLLSNEICDLKISRNSLVVVSRILFCVKRKHQSKFVKRFKCQILLSAFKVFTRIFVFAS